MNATECFQSAVKSFEDENLLTSDEDATAITVIADPRILMMLLQLYGMRLFDAGLYEPTNNFDFEHEDDEWIFHFNK